MKRSAGLEETGHACRTLAAARVSKLKPACLPARGTHLRRRCTRFRVGPARRACRQRCPAPTQSAFRRFLRTWQAGGGSTVGGAHAASRAERGQPCTQQRRARMRPIHRASSPSTWVGEAYFDASLHGRAQQALGTAGFPLSSGGGSRRWGGHDCWTSGDGNAGQWRLSAARCATLGEVGTAASARKRGGQPAVALEHLRALASWPMTV